jgi:hypothetical protein
MQVVNSYDELISIIDTNKKNAGSVFQIKQGPHQFHDGHKYLVEKTKQNFDKMIVMLLNQKLYYDIYTVLYDKYNYKPDIVTEWDKKGTLTYLESIGVDIVSIEENFVTKEEIIEKQEQAWRQIILPYVKYFPENNIHGFNRLIGVQVFVIAEMLRPRPYTRVLSYKDGMIAFVMKDIFIRYFGQEYLVYEPLKNYQNNLYFSTNHKNFTLDELQLVSNLFENIKTIDLKMPYDLMKQTLSNVDNGLSVFDIIISDKDIITDYKTFIDVHFYVNGKITNFGIFRD